MSGLRAGVRVLADAWERTSQALGGEPDVAQVYARLAARLRELLDDDEAAGDDPVWSEQNVRDVVTNVLWSLATAGHTSVTRDEVVAALAEAGIDEGAIR